MIAVQDHPVSNWQVDEQPSPAAVFLSSQASRPLLIPSPHLLQEVVAGLY